MANQLFNAKRALPAGIFPFLMLPPELRNKVYACIKPFDGSVSDSVGLLLSCKQVYYEAQSMITGIIGRPVGGIIEKWNQSGNPELRITIPTAFADLNRPVAAVVTFPLSCFLTSFEDNLCTVSPGGPFGLCRDLINATMQSIALLDVECVEIAFYEDSGFPARTTHQKGSPTFALILGFMDFEAVELDQLVQPSILPNKVILNVAALRRNTEKLNVCADTICQLFDDSEETFWWRLELQDSNGQRIRTPVFDLYDRAFTAWYTGICSDLDIPCRAIWTKKTRRVITG